MKSAMMNEVTEGKANIWIECEACFMWTPLVTADVSVARECLTDEKFVCCRCIHFKKIEDRLLKVETFLESQFGNNMIMKNEVSRDARKSSSKQPSTKGKLNVRSDSKHTHEAAKSKTKTQESTSENGKVSRKQVGKIKAVEDVNHQSVEKIVIGDSMCKYLGDALSRKDRNVTRVCLPGASVLDVCQVVENSNSVKEGDTVAVWVGTNDVLRHNERTSLEYYVKLLKNLEQKKCKIYVLGLCLRGNRGKYYNMELQRLCQELGANFIDFGKMWNQKWMSKDGVHLSKYGNTMVSKEVGRVMHI